MNLICSSLCLQIRRSVLRIATCMLMTVALMAVEGAVGAETAGQPFLSDEDMANVGVARGTRTGEQTPSVTGAVTDMALALVVVIGLVAATGWVVRRSGAKRKLLGASGRHMELVESLPLGLKRAVSLIRVGDRVVLIGQSEQGLAGLGEFDQRIIDPDAPSQVPQQQQSTSSPAAEATSLARLGDVLEQLLSKRAPEQAQNAGSGADQLAEQEKVAGVEADEALSGPAGSAASVAASEPAEPIEEAPSQRIARFQERLRAATEGRS